MLHAGGQPTGWPVISETQGVGLMVTARSHLGASSVATLRGCLRKGRAGASAQTPTQQNSMDGNARCFIRYFVSPMRFNSLL